MLAANFAQKAFGLQPISNLYKYRQNMRSERQKKIVLTTKNQLGVVPFANQWDKRYLAHPWINDTIPYYGADEIVDFFKVAELETKLAFIRDFQYQDDHDHLSVEVIYEELQTLGMFREAHTFQTYMNL